jgi:hypothetical protein
MCVFAVVCVYLSERLNKQIILLEINGNTMISRNKLLNRPYMISHELKHNFQQKKNVELPFTIVWAWLVNVISCVRINL